MRKASRLISLGCCPPVDFTGTLLVYLCKKCFPGFFFLHSALLSKLLDSNTVGAAPQLNNPGTKSSINPLFLYIYKKLIDSVTNYVLQNSSALHLEYINHIEALK